MTDPVQYGAPVRRHGMTVNAGGKQASLGGLWPQEWAQRQPESFIGRLGSLRKSVLPIAQRLHNQNEAARTAKALNKPAAIPEPAVRRKLAEAERQKLSGLLEQFKSIDTDVLKFRGNLKPFEYDNGDANLRAELRSFLRTAPEKQRQSLMAKPKFKRALLEPGAPPELSGLTDMVHARLRSESIAAAFPTETATINEFEQATERFGELVKTVENALANELTAVGAPPDTGPAPADGPAWD